MITGPANRRFLTKDILDFCGAFAIYNTEIPFAYKPSLTDQSNKAEGECTI